jgi:hypothetical protein
MEKPAAPVGRSGLLLIGEYPVVSRNLGGGAGGDIERKGDILMFGASTTCKTPHKTLERGGGDRLKVFFPAKLQQGALMSDFGEYGPKDHLTFSQCGVVFLGMQPE